MGAELDRREHHAREFAARWHGTQTRRYTGEPYIIHPAAVADLVRSVPHDPAMLCAGWLHDVLEDTKCRPGDILEEFGEDVLGLVLGLTDVSRPEHGNRELRKAIDRAHISGISPRAKTVKIADLIDNSRGILQHDPNYARVYIPEKAKMLTVLTDGDRHLWSMAYAIVTEATVRLHGPLVAP